MTGEPANVVVPARKWKIGLCLLAIFLCGALIGGLVTMQVVRGMAVRRSNPANWSALVLANLDQRLHLTPEQRRALEPILRSSTGEILEVRNRALIEVTRVVRRARTKAAPELSLDQRRELDTFLRERAALVHRWGAPLPAGSAVSGDPSPAPLVSPAAP